MASPFAPYPWQSSENGPVTMAIEFVVGATGAVPSTGGGNGNGTTGGKGELGLPVRNGVGDYTFPMLNACVRLIDCNAFCVGPHSTTAGKYAELIADSSTSTSSPSVRFQFTRGDTGAAAEVAQNDVIKVILCVLSKN